MNEKQRKLIVDLILKKINQENFLAEFDPRFTGRPEQILELLKEAQEHRKPDDLDCTLMLAGFFNVSWKEYVPILIQLFAEDWHFKHEDIALIFEDLKDSRSIEILYQTALKEFEYLKYNESQALARKCTWALARIGTPETLEKLRLLATCDKPAVCAFARKRLPEFQ